MKNIIVRVRTIGQSFGCEGVVIERTTGKTLATTRTFPYGMRTQARLAAEALAEKERKYSHS